MMMMMMLIFVSLKLHLPFFLSIIDFVFKAQSLWFEIVGTWYRLSFILDNIRIYECEGRIEKSVPLDHRLSSLGCRVMTTGDPEGRIFLSYPNTHDRFLYSCSPLFLFIYLFI